MPLPQPIRSSYVPRTFGDPKAEAQTRTALELYFRYHPGAIAQRRYEAMLASEQWKSAQLDKQIAMLASERDQVLKNLSNFRETGLGPSGRAGGAAGGSGGAARFGVRGGGPSRAGADFGDFADVAQNAIDLELGAAKHGLASLGFIGEEFRIPSTHRVATNRVVNAVRGAQDVREAAFLLGSILEAQQDSLLRSADVTVNGRNAAAVELFRELNRVRPEFFYDRNGNPTELGKAMAEVIDEQFQTEDKAFLSASYGVGIEPSARLEERRRAYIQAADKNAPGKPGIQTFTEELLKEYGVSTPEQLTPERFNEFKARLEAEKARRASMGIPEPLSIEEQLFLSRYMDALRDDGVAELAEFASQEEYDKAKAAYEKGRLVEALPRGAAAFYDESYLRGLGRLGQIDRQMQGLEAGREDPFAAAQRGALGLPKIDAATLDAAAQVHPMMPEVLPFAMRRVQQSGGLEAPTSQPERFMRRVMDADTSKSLDFPAALQAAYKRYKDDPASLREALAYFGAVRYIEQTGQATLSPAAKAGDAAGAARLRDEFEREIVAPQVETGIRPLSPSPAFTAPTDVGGPPPPNYHPPVTEDFVLGGGVVSAEPSPEPLVAPYDFTAMPPRPGAMVQPLPTHAFVNPWLEGNPLRSLMPRAQPPQGYGVLDPQLTRELFLRSQPDAAQPDAVGVGLFTPGGLW